jgi:hypothetical protein
MSEVGSSGVSRGGALSAGVHSLMMKNDTTALNARPPVTLPPLSSVL